MHDSRNILHILTLRDDEDIIVLISLSYCVCVEYHATRYSNVLSSESREHGQKRFVSSCEKRRAEEKNKIKQEASEIRRKQIDPLEYVWIKALLRGSITTMYQFWSATYYVPCVHLSTNFPCLWCSIKYQERKVQ